MTVGVRPWRVDDAEALDRAMRESVDHLRPWMAFVADEPKPLAERRSWIADCARESEDRVFGIFAGDQVAGGCGLHRRIGPGGLEIGYWVHPRFTRQGVATAAVGELCGLAFADPGIDRVEIHHDAANEASAAVARRAGFAFVEARPDTPEAPAETGVEWIWRLER